MDELLIQRDLTPDQRTLFQSEMSRVRKDPTVALLLCLFLGGLGAHQFYMGNVLAGVLYLLFCWTFIPMIVSFVELFLITQRVHRYNEQRAIEVWQRVKIFPKSSLSNPDPLRPTGNRLYCTQCGHEMPSKASFCSSCGKAVASVVP
jgi:TM2 domain-containing membrane protein YozV